MADAHPEEVTHPAGTPVKKQPDVLLKVFTDILSGTVAGLCGKFIEYPFDTVKVRLQTQSVGEDLAALGQVHFKGPIDCLVKTFRNEGIRGLYKGVMSPVYGAMLQNATCFVMFGLGKRVFQSLNGPDTPLSLPQLALCGAFSGLGSSTVLTPVELIKCQLQISQKESKSVVRTAQKIVKTSGVGGLFYGFSGTLLREVPGNTAWFGTYEAMLRLLTSRSGISRDQAELKHTIMSGAAAGMMYWAIPYPADSIKSRIQTGVGTGGHKTLAAVAMHMFRTEGPESFYRGALVTVCRAAPSNAVVFSSYEFVSRGLNRLLLGECVEVAR